MCSHFQICPQMFTQVKCGLWLGHSRIFRVVPKPSLYELRCVLSVTVLLEDKPLPWFEIQALWSSLELISQFLLLKNVPTHNATTTMLYCKYGIAQVTTVAQFPPDKTLGIRFDKPSNCTFSQKQFMWLPIFGELIEKLHFELLATKKTIIPFILAPLW